MAGFFFGKSRWDDLPQQLGMTVAETGGVMSGTWRGIPVEAYFYNRHDRVRDAYDHFTDVQARLDPPLGVEWLESAEPWTIIVDGELQGEFHARTKALGMQHASIGDGGIRGTWAHYESSLERYRAAFDLFAWAAQIILERRAKNPPPWELEIASQWPSLAQGWGMTLDVRRGSMSGIVRGLATSVMAFASRQQAHVTRVEVAVPFPPGSELSLARQEGGNGFFDRLFRGQDVTVGDAAFDAAFVIKGKPEAWIRSVLGPAAREEILALVDGGVAIEIEDGKLTAWARKMVLDRESLDRLMKAAYAAAVALCPPTTAPSQTPYR
jgi:hypothetical protein